MRFEIGQEVETPNGRGTVVDVDDGRDDSLRFLLGGYPTVRVYLRHYDFTEIYLMHDVRPVSALEQIAEAAD